jgi:hypothetical protein
MSLEIKVILLFGALWIGYSFFKQLIINIINERIKKNGNRL